MLSRWTLSPFSQPKQFQCWFRAGSTCEPVENFFTMSLHHSSPAIKWCNSGTSFSGPESVQKKQKEWFQPKHWPRTDRRKEVTAAWTNYSVCMKINQTFHHFLCTAAISLLYQTWSHQNKSPEGLTLKRSMHLTADAWSLWTFILLFPFKIQNVMCTVMVDLYSASTLIPFALVVGWCCKLTIWFCETLYILPVSLFVDAWGSGGYGFSSYWLLQWFVVWWLFWWFLNKVSLHILLFWGFICFCLTVWDFWSWQGFKKMFVQKNRKNPIYLLGQSVHCCLISVFFHFPWISVLHVFGQGFYFPFLKCCNVSLSQTWKI